MEDTPTTLIQPPLPSVPLLVSNLDTIQAIDYLLTQSFHAAYGRHTDDVDDGTVKPAAVVGKQS